MKSLQLVNNEREMEGRKQRKGRRSRMMRKAMKRRWEGSVRQTGFAFLVSTSPKYGKQKRSGSLISGSRNPLFKTIGSVVLLLSLLTRVVVREAAFFIVLPSTALYSGRCVIAAVHLLFTYSPTSLTFLEHSLLVTGKEKPLCLPKLVVREWWWGNEDTCT